MKKVAIPLIIAGLLLGSMCQKNNTTQEVSGIEDLVLPESAFPDGVGWDPHPPDSTNPALCGVVSNPFVSRSPDFLHCFCTRWFGMSDSMASTARGALVEILYHEGEIGIYAIEYESDSAALAGYEHLTSRYQSVRYTFLLESKYTIWVWCDSENDTVYVHRIADYYRNLFGG